jgi:hypothetical protein
MYLRTLEDFRLMIEFFRQHGIEPSVSVGLDDTQWVDFMRLAQEWKREEEEWGRVPPEPETEEEKKRAENEAREEYKKILFHSSG